MKFESREAALGVHQEGMGLGWHWAVRAFGRKAGAGAEPSHGRALCSICRAPRDEGNAGFNNLGIKESPVLRRGRCRVLWNQVLKQCQEAGENPSRLLSQKILCFILSLDFEPLQGGGNCGDWIKHHTWLSPLNHEH